jgi:hypothetical protein
MKRLFLVFILGNLLCLIITFPTQCDTQRNKEKCISIPSCLWAENKYGKYIEWQCLYFDSTELMEKFCKLYDKMNIEEGFKTVSCESKTYRHK